MATTTRTPAPRQQRRPWALVMLEHRIGQPFATYVTERRVKGRSYRAIAAELSKLIGADIPYETVRVWSGECAAADDTAA